MDNDLENVYVTTVSYDTRTLLLLELLSEKSEELANMLKGAWVVLSTKDNPDMLPQVAHSMRELMEKAPIKLPSVPIVQGTKNLKNDVKELGDKWAIMVKCRDETSLWNGEIDASLCSMLNEFSEFFDNFSTKYQPRNEQNSALIQALDGSGGHMPAQLLKAKLNQWNELREFFLSVAHHGKPNVTIEEVTEAVVILEAFLLDLMMPEPIPDLNELDSLIAEGEDI